MKPEKPQLNHFIYAVGLIILPFILATLPSWQALWTLWTEDGSGYSHGLLILGVCVWLIYECWDELQQSQNSKLQYPLALIFGFGASITWSLGYLTGIALLYWVSLPIMATGIVVAFSKHSIRATALAPGLALAFALPLWELLVPSLQGLAVFAVSIMLKFLQLPAFIKGMEVSIPGGRFVVEGGCSGVRFLLVSIALSSLWSFLHLHKTKHRVLLIGFSIFISIVSNWIRILIIILIGYKTEMQSAIIYDHGYFGWVIFAITLIPICGLAFWLERRTQVTKNTALKTQFHKPHWQKGKLIVYLLTISIIPMLSRIYVATLPQIPEPLLHESINASVFSNVQQQIQPQFNLNTGQKHTIFGGWKPSFSGIDTWQIYEYTPSGIQILIGHIAKQSQTQELFSAGNSFEALNPSIQWHQSTAGDFLTLQNIYGQRWVAKLFYLVGGDFAKMGISGKLMQLKNTFQRRLDGQLFIVGFPCETNCNTEKTKLQSIDNNTLQNWIRSPATKP